MTDSNAWYKINKIEEIDTPALIVYPQRILENIRTLKNMIDDSGRLRPHVKTHKTKEATFLMMAEGINKFKCATIAEAEMLGMCTAGDVLLAYQPYGPKLQRFTALIKRYPNTNFSCLIDNLDSSEQISEIAVQKNLTIPVFLDINSGMNRTGIAPGKIAIKLFEDCSKLKGIKMMGLHVYDGHINISDIQKRTEVCNAGFEPVLEMQKALSKPGRDKLLIIAGGSPTFPIHAKRSDIECSPGTFIFWDKGYHDLLPEQKFLPAALVLTRVISLPNETQMCLDLGHKSIAAENPLNHRVHFLNASDLTFVGQSEEHLVVTAGKNHSWKIGDILYGLPIHICPTCALYGRALIVENGNAGGSWKIIAREREITI